MKNYIDNYFEILKNTIDSIEQDELVDITNVILNAKKKNNTVFVMGNGGSATTASHFVCDLAKGTANSGGARLKIVGLTDNIASIMAYANDFNYDDVFVEQLKNFLQKDDVVIAFSGSGNSKNVIKAIEYANSKNAITIGFTGYNGGELKKIAKYSFNSNRNDMQISEDLHLMAVHIIMQLINKQIF